MASYSVRFQPSVEKDLRNLPQGIASRVMLRIDSLRDNPSHTAVPNSPPAKERNECELATIE